MNRATNGERLRLVVDASVAVKWIAPEDDSIIARRIFEKFDVIAPQLIYAECANIIWKKVRGGNLPQETAVEAAELLASMTIEAVSLKPMMLNAVDLSVRLNHPAYDCFYLALAIAKNCHLVTADGSFLRVLAQSCHPELLDYCLSLADAAA